MVKRDIYQEITDKIVSVLERTQPGGWQSPFAGLAAQGLPRNPVTDHRYQGINIPSLWVDQQKKGFTANEWATFKQWRDKGASVRKGEKASPIIFYKTLTKEDESPNGETQEIAIPMMRFYAVFNANQVEGYEGKTSAPANNVDLVERIKTADEFCKATGANIHHGGAGAYYDPNRDLINIPKTINFRETDNASATENYYATLLHELTHWSGASHRLNRAFAGSESEKQKYAFEELVAELGAAFLCSALQITQAPREDHAHYLKNWLQALKNDKKYIFKASAQAAKAAEYLHALQGGRA